MPPTITVAIAQTAPVLLDRAATIERVVNWITRAADDGHQLVTFGEAFVPGYPVWTERTDGARFNSDLQKHFHAMYLREAVCLDDGDLDPVTTVARERSIGVVLGVIERPSERGGHSLYCTCVVITPDGRIASAHRKLMPTYEERLSWSIGDGAGLVTHAFHGFTLGALNCWENWMPLARTALYAHGENLHVAIWPGSVHNTCEITRFIARESRSYVISASSLLRGSDIPTTLPERDRLAAGDDDMLHNGGSCIAGPDGAWIVEPVPHDETLISATIDRERVYEERQNFDPVGHYARPDVFHFRVDRTRQALDHDEPIA